MAKRNVPPAGPQPRSADEAPSPLPAPPNPLNVTFTPLAKDEVLHRVHQNAYRPDQFNPGAQGNARFSPIKNALGKPIPTLYGGTTMACALMKTVFQDVPHTAGFKSFDKRKLIGQVHSRVLIGRALQLVDLASIPLRKLGVTRAQLIDSEKNHYSFTRQWAQAIHHQCPQAQGLSWVSRQDDTARAVILFGDRIPDGTLQPDGTSRSLLDDGDAYDAVLDVAERIGVYIVPGIG